MAAIKITDGVYAVGGTLLSHPNDCATYLVIGEKPVLIDCGCGEGFDRMRRNIEGLGVAIADIAYVIGTHGHYDHINGIARLRDENPGLQLAMHEADAEQIEIADPDLTCAGWFFGIEIQPLRVDVKLLGGETFEAGGVEFEIIHVPGHTPGSIAVVAEIGGKRVLFCGDCYVPGCDRVRSDYDSWLSTLDTLNNIEFDVVLPGHIMQLAFDPFCAMLSTQRLSKKLSRNVFIFLKDNFSRQIWPLSTFNYEYITPFFAKLSKK
jgi:metallo-beta-lactamase class B